MASLTSSSKQESNVVLDALPYVDPVNEDYEQYALALIEEEMKAHAATTSVKKAPPVHFRTELMKQEYQELSTSASDNIAGDNADGADGQGPKRRPEQRQRAAVVEPVSPPAAGQDPEAWKQAVQTARIAYEAERIRSDLLELEKDGLGSSAQMWKVYNELLSQSQAVLQQALSTQRQSVEDINLSRQQDQQQCGRKLEVLTTQYHELVHKLFQLKQAVAEMEQDVLQ
jgi:pre-mRNA-splicing factor SPF27